MPMLDFSTLNAAAPDYMEKSFAANMVRYAPNGMAPLFALSSMLGDKNAASVEHGYFAKTMVFPSVTLTAAVADGVATTFTVASTANIVAKDLLRAQSTGEVVQVATIPSGTSITVRRAVGQIAAAAIGNGVKLYGIGNAFEQGSTRPASRLMLPQRVLNYTHIFRNTWALPGTLEAIKNIVGDGNVAESRMDCGLFHAADIEKSLIFSQRSSQIVDGQYMTTMDGIVETVRRLAPAANTNTAGGTTNWTQLEAMLNPVFNTVNDGRNGNERVLVVGGSARTVLNNIGRLNGTYQLVDGQNNFGLQFVTFKTSRGMFRMIEHPMLNSNDDWSKMAIAVDIPTMKIAYLPGRKTQNREYNMSGTPVDNGVDAVGGTLTSELTLELLNPSANAVIYGLTAAAVG
jgi:hypothetical protein